MQDAIRAFQRKLLDLGYDVGRADGVIGPRTAQAFEDFLDDNDFRFSVAASNGRLQISGPLPRDTGSDHPLPWMAHAYGVIGLHETRDNARLREWLRSDGGTLGDPARFPWCGDFVHTALRLGLPQEPFPGRVGENPYLARNWLEFGSECAPSVGAVLVFWRGSPEGTFGHVGFYVGEDATRYYVLGGNQSNGVSVAPLAKGRLLGARWPSTTTARPDGPRHISHPEMALSLNEA